MVVLVHAFVFLAASAVVWFFAGILIEAIARVAERLHTTKFSVAFFVLGFLTSISELSVALTATINGSPQVSLGNLAGASFVILLLIIPFLAVIGKGIDLKHSISRRNMLLAFAVIALPVLLALDGDITRPEGIISLLAYFTLAYGIQRQSNSVNKIREMPEDFLGRKRTTAIDLLKILAGGAAIFIASHFLVEEAVYFADRLGVPSSLMGLLLLSIGTNVPELVVAAQSVFKRYNEIAFGDYLGSAVANTAIFGLLALMNGRFFLEAQGFLTTMLVMLAGLILFYFFARSGERISHKEGWILLSFYVLFVIVQFVNIAMFAGH